MGKETGVCGRRAMYMASELPLLEVFKETCLPWWEERYMDEVG